MILGFDISNHQWPVNMGAARSAGRDFVVIKATEGVGFTDPRLAAHRANAHAAGLVVGLYAFARDNSPAAEAAYFAGAVGALQPGEFLVLDQEVTHAGGNVAWCSAWLDAVRARYGIAPLIYMNQGSSTGVTSGDWTQLAKTYGLWIARYDGAPAAQNAVSFWGVPAMKQYSDAGSVLGVPGTCDVDSFFGTTAQLLAYGKGGTPAPAPTPVEIDMQLTDLIESRIPSDVDPATGKGRMVPLFALLENIQVLAYQGSQRPSVSVDAAALAAALLADDAAVAKLGDAIAAGLAKRVGNG